MCVTIKINMAKKCAECGKGGAVQSGICLRCIAQAIRGVKMVSAIGKAVQARMEKRWNEEG